MEQEELKKETVTETKEPDLFDSDVDYVHPADLELAHSVAFHSRTFKAASKSQKDDMYADEHIITDRLDNQLNVMTPSLMKQEDKEELSSAAASKSILEGIVVGVQHINPNDDKSTPCAVIAYGYNTYKVLIPYYCFFDIPLVKDLSGEHPYEAIKRRILSMVSVDINFIVRMVDEKTQTAIGDRLKALSDISYRNFRREDKHGGHRAKVGALCEARILRVGVKDMTLCCLGCDVNMKVADGECSWNHISNLAAKFHAGEWVKVKVLSAENYTTKVLDNQYDLTRLTVSIRQATPDPSDMYWNMISENQICLAYYSGRDDSGHYFGHLFSEDGPDILIAAPKFGNRTKLNIGDKISVRVNKKHEAADGKKRRYEGTFTF